MSGTEALAVWDMGLASGMSKQVLCSFFLGIAQGLFKDYIPKSWRVKWKRIWRRKWKLWLCNGSLNRKP